MRILHLIGIVPTARRRAASRPAPAFKPSLEFLEDRLVPASINLNNGYGTIYGTFDGSHTHDFYDFTTGSLFTGNGGLVRVTVYPASSSFDPKLNVFDATGGTVTWQSYYTDPQDYQFGSSTDIDQHAGGTAESAWFPLQAYHNYTAIVGSYGGTTGSYYVEVSELLNVNGTTMYVNGSSFYPDNFQFTQSNQSQYRVRLNNFDSYVNLNAGVTTFHADGKGNFLNSVGAPDVAVISGIPGTPEVALLGSGGGVIQQPSLNNANFIHMYNFSTSYFYGTHADSAELFDSPGNDIFVTAGTYAYMTGPGAFRLASGCGNVYGYTINGGSDQAWHYDSAGGIDSFVASGNAFAYMSGTAASGASFFNESVGFAVNYGIATHGDALAYLIDSPGNDAFVGYSSYSYLSGNANGKGVFNVAESFNTVYAQSFVGGTDYAYLYDSYHNVLGGKWSRLA